MRRYSSIFIRYMPAAVPLIAVLGAWLSARGAPARVGGSTPDAFHQSVRPFLQQHCFACHGGAKPRGDLALDKLTADSALSSRAAWESVDEALGEGYMPPPTRPRPAAEEVRAVRAWIAAALADPPCAGNHDPGRPALRRLNRAEYNNTIRDLCGVEFRPADEFPADDTGYGFDNIGDVLTMSPLLVEKYLAAAEQIVDKMLAGDASRKKLLIAAPGGAVNEEMAARQVVERFARRAFRRPVEQGEVDRLMKLYRSARQGGEAHEKALRLPLSAVLVSPHFLFRIERDPPGAAIHPISEHELATRLSYFLWNSMPDSVLFELADRGALRKPGEIERQVRRMLADSRALAFVESFTGQWLELRNLDQVRPDTQKFPAYSERMARSMRREAETFFAHLVREDRRIMELLDADYTFIDERLARLYGIPGVKGTDFQRVSLAGTRRGGVLTMAGVLTVTSMPARTSPVKRGKWVLDALLGDAPPPPPPDVPALVEKSRNDSAATLRQRLEQHRADPTCASCHVRMDGIGFALENFDAIGAWRDRDDGAAIDATGELPGGAKLNGPTDLKEVLLSRKDQFAKNLVERMMTYALGRGLTDADRCMVRDIQRDLAAKEHRFSALVLGIVNSDAFQKRKAR